MAVRLIGVEFSQVQSVVAQPNCRGACKNIYQKIHEDNQEVSIISLNFWRIIKFNCYHAPLITTSQ